MGGWGRAPVEGVVVVQMEYSNATGSCPAVDFDAIDLSVFDVTVTRGAEVLPGRAVEFIAGVRGTAALVWRADAPFEPNTE